MRKPTAAAKKEHDEHEFMTITRPITSQDIMTNAKLKLSLEGEADVLMARVHMSLARLIKLKYKD